MKELDMTEQERRHHDAPVDGRLTDALAEQSLRATIVDDATRDEVDPWLEAVVRGFLDGERTEVQREAFFSGGSYRRKLGVYDDASPQAQTPVATFASWGSRLSLPGGAVPVCAISSVTVAPTHRRRGLLRAMMTAELNTAADLGFPVAALTVSESGIYGRFGFAPAAAAAQWTIDTRRAGWRGPLPSGRIDFVSREQGREAVEALHARIQADSPGEIEMPGGHWDRFFGTRPDAEKAGEIRVLQYRAPDGAVDGMALYRVSENHDDFAASALDVSLLLAATDDAYAALWRFVLSMDLISTVRAGELSVDEPLWWMIADQRAATISLRDHHYLRVLDVPAALSARRYEVPGRVILDVRDPLGFAEGRFLLDVDAEGAATVEPVDGDVEPDVSLGVGELSALLLGGVSALTLARAGRLQAADPSGIHRLFASSQVPRLSFWY
jgi:predicted acetyltransferase